MIAFLPIKPSYALKILKGSKKFEFRKKRFSKDIKIVIIYASAPMKKIIGCFKIEKIYKENPYIIWEKCKTSAGIQKKIFLDYFKNNDNAIAIEIADIFKFKKSVNPKEIWLNFKIPQSFKYMEDNEFRDLINYEPSLRDWVKIYNYSFF